MSKAKRIVVISLILLFVGSMVLVPLFENNTKESDSASEVLAQFAFQNNLEIYHGLSRDINIIHTSLRASKVELYLDDSLLSSWNHPPKKIKFQLNSEKLKVGAKELRLAIYKGGTLAFEDSRLLVILSDIVPIRRKASVVKLYPHNQGHFTQGLEFNGNTLYEGTGQNGSSLLAKIDMSTGNPTQEVDLESTYFGEGITILGNKVYQITWQQQKCFVYNKETLEKVSEINYNGEGWGLTNNGSQLIMTDGSERIYLRDPSSFEILKTIEVYDNKGPISNLNELEYIDGKIYANVWQQDFIVVIDPISGKVLEKIDCSEVILKARGTGEVLNGIAYQASTKKLFLTGKNWSNMAEVRLK